MVAVALSGMIGAPLVADGAGASSGEAPEGSSDAPALDLATAETRDLARTTELDGVVGRGEVRRLRLSSDGTVTKLPETGSTVESGQPLVEVDGDPVVLFGGERPAWRALGPGIDDGEDIRQLEFALAALGYADPATVELDDTWTAATTAAVKAFQKATGLSQDGRLDLAEFVFGPPSVRLATVTGELGDGAAEIELSVTWHEPSIEAAVDAEDAGLVAVGDHVTAELADGSGVDAVVSEIGPPEVGEDGAVTRTVTFTASGLDDFDGTPVELDVEMVAAEAAVAVPVEAVLALAEGGYAVEVPDTDAPGGTRLVGVELGVFADGWVQIVDGLAAGDQVVVP